MHYSFIAIFCILGKQNSSITTLHNIKKLNHNTKTTRNKTTLSPVCSNVNNSDLRRWAMAVSVNKRLNNPVIEHHCPQYYPLYMLPNSAIMECENVNSTEEKG